MARTELMVETVETGTEWLTTLEEKVRTAADRIRELREQNAALQRRVADLEERLAAAPSSDETGRWHEERQEIRHRVERMVEHLEGLLGEA